MAGVKQVSACTLMCTKGAAAVQCCPDPFAIGQVQHMLLSGSALPPTGTLCAWKGAPEKLIFTKTMERNHFSLLFASLSDA